MKNIGDKIYQAYIDRVETHTVINVLSDGIILAGNGHNRFPVAFEDQRLGKDRNYSDDYAWALRRRVQMLEDWLQQKENVVAAVRLNLKEARETQINYLEEIK